MTKYITVGYDASPEAAEALEWAAHECEARGTMLSIVTCYALPVAGDVQTGWIPTEAYAEIAQGASAELERAEEATRAAHPTLDVQQHVMAGSAATNLVDQAGSGQQLVVVGPSSHRGSSAFWLGSTPRSLVRHAHCPVVIVRGAPRGGRPNRVVVGVDHSDGARQALEWAVAEAELHDVPVVVVHAWDYPYAPPGPGQSQMIDHTRVDAALVLEQAVSSMRERTAVDVTGELVEGSPAPALLDVVSDGDLLVLGSRGRGALRAGVFGSTVHSVLDNAPVPVVIVR